MTDPSFIGRSLRRVEDGRLLRGEGRYVADIDVPGVVHLAVVRSMLAHGRIDGVDLDHTRAMPGVLDAFSGKDVAERLRPFRSHRALDPAWEALLQAPLAVDTVRYVGEPVAVVVAESRALAEDAVAQVIVEVEELPVVASTAGSPEAELFPGRSNRVSVLHKSSGVTAEEALTRADVVVEREFRVQRHSGMPLETRGLLARPDDDGGVTVWGVTKMPHTVRAAIADVLDLDEELVRVRPVDVGGGFGVRGELYPEDFLVPFAALRLDRPVRWIEDRNEHLVAINHSREGLWRLRAGATRDGDLVFLHAEVTLDIGAYVRPLVGVMAEQCAVNLVGPYRVGSVACSTECVLTNKTGIGTMRAPGRFEATFAREGILDMLAAELAMSPVELRDRNLLGAADYPYDTGMQSYGKAVIYDSGDPRDAFRRAVAAVKESVPVAPAGHLIGVGVIPFVESTGRGPFEQARLAVEAPGHVVVHVGTTSMGQGHETTFAQIAADAVGVDVADVRVLAGDPCEVAESVGTFASRSLVMAGNAIWVAGTELRGRIESVDADRTLGLAEVMRRAAEERIDLEVEGRFESADPTYAYGAHAAVVAVDPDLGSLQVLRYLVVADVGRVVNPQIVVGQVQGGVVVGLGGALLEELAYSEDGQPLSTTFMDYLLPSVLEVPRVEVRLLDQARAPGNPLGVKGAGEIGTIAVGAAIAAAARDALPSLVGSLTDLPLKPERLLALG